MTLSPEARALFEEAREASERPDAGVPDDARRRMRAHVLAAAAAGGATAATAAKAATAAVAANAATANVSGAGVVGKTMIWLGSLSMGKVVLGFAAAAGLTLGGLTVVDSESTPATPAPTSPSQHVAPIPPSTARTPLARDIESADDEMSPDEPETAPAPPIATAPSATPETLQEQAALLMRARDAIRAGRHGEAQHLLNGYRERYGEGALGEEQEALTVLNLCGSDDPRGPEAAERFAARHPGSPLLQRIEQSCR
ncbi:MAG TPA: hypothetical protein ENK57_02275 [Polyangiaceae bacterium]|nr:hypothetical protein [Polyangiaceae bacterium]